MFAIRNKHTGEWLYGTDYNHDPPQQRLSHDDVMIFVHPYSAEFEFTQRKCTDDYEIVKVEVTAVEMIECIGYEKRYPDFIKYCMGGE